MQSPNDHIDLIWGLVVVSFLLTIGLVWFSLKDSFRPLFAPELDHCLEHVSHHLHLCVNHLQQDWNSGGLIFVIFIVALWNKQFLEFLYRSWKYFINSNAVVWLSQKHDDFFLLNTSRPMIFTMGFFNPKIFCSEGLLKQVSEQELKALITHEQCHVKYKDSLIKWLVRSFGTCFFNQNRMSEDLNLRMEQRADLHALKGLKNHHQLRNLFERFTSWASLNRNQDYYCAFSESQTKQRLDLIHQAPEYTKSKKILIWSGLFSTLVLPILQSPSAEQLHHFTERFWSFLIS